MFLEKLRAQLGEW